MLEDGKGWSLAQVFRQRVPGTRASEREQCNEGQRTMQGLTSHQTHYRSYWGRVFTSQMTQPTVSKHWRKIGSKDQAAIPSGPSHRAHNNTTTMQCETKTHKIPTDEHKYIYAQWNGLSLTKPNPENCSSKCAYDCAHLQYTIQHSTVLTISPLNSRQPSQCSDVVYRKRGARCNGTQYTSAFKSWPGTTDGPWSWPLKQITSK